MEPIHIVVILIVTLLSVLGLYFFLLKPLSGKTFDEMLKERRELHEKILGTSATTGGGTKSSKDNAASGKKSKKANKKTQQQQPEQQKQHSKGSSAKTVKESDGGESESNASSESAVEEEINPLTYATKKKVNASIEYVETEAFSLNDGHSKKKDKTSQGGTGGGNQGGTNQGGGKKKQSKAGGILVNKAEPVLVKQEAHVPEANHFEEIHPKDALEIARQQKEEERSKQHQHQHHQNAKEQRKQNKQQQQQQSKNETVATAPAEKIKSHHSHGKNIGGNAPLEAPVVTKATPVEAKVSAAHHHQHHQAAPASSTAAKAAQDQRNHAIGSEKSSQSTQQKDTHKDTSRDNSNKEKPSNKSNKKLKQHELITQQLAAEVQDASTGNVQSLVRILAKAELPRNDIQILIDFLLNKQQDTLAKDPSEWNDPLQKLKKQLADKEAQLVDEQRDAAGLQDKLKKLRAELNADKVQHAAVMKGVAEEMNAKKLEIANLSQQLQLLSDKYTTEKQLLSGQYGQLQAQYRQLSEKHATVQESAATLGQLNENIQLLQHELLTKNQLLNEKLQVEEELLKKKTEYEMLLRSKDEIIQQRMQEMGAYENELQGLRVAAAERDEFAQKLQQQSYEMEQLKAQVGDLQAKQKQAAAAVAAAAAANNQVEESSKVEIRNLQNALDSSKTELNGCRSTLASYEGKIKDCEHELQELRSHKEDLQKQIEEQKAKNNELSASLKNATNHIAEAAAAAAATPKVDIDKVILEEQTRTKDLLVKLLPSEIVSALPLDASNFHCWLESAVACIREQQESLLLRVSASNNNSTEVHLNCNNNSSASRSNSSNNASNTTSSSLYANSDADEGAAKNEDDVSDGGAAAAGGGASSSSNNKNGAPELPEAAGSETIEDPKVLVLKNEQLQKTVDQYKTIIADTELMLKNLESKVIEQDIHWRSVVQAKEKELTLLKSAGALQ